MVRVVKRCISKKFNMTGHSYPYHLISISHANTTIILYSLPDNTLLSVGLAEALNPTLQKSQPLILLIAKYSTVYGSQLSNFGVNWVMLNINWVGGADSSMKFSYHRKIKCIHMFR